MPPTELPAELFCVIASHIDSYDDALNLALTCKANATLLLPQLPFWDIRAKLGAIELWKFLSRPDDLHATYVRTLDIIPNNFYDVISLNRKIYDVFKERLPKDLAHTDTVHASLNDILGNEAALIGALKRMTRLRRFRWYRVPPPILHGKNDVWNTLKGLRTVHDVEVFDLHDTTFGWPTEHSILAAKSDSLLSLTGLSRFSLCTSAFDSGSGEPDASVIFDMLFNNSPYLETLIVDLTLFGHIDTANIDPLLSNALFPNLMTLRLQGFHAHNEPLVRFLINHPTIQDLALSPMMSGHFYTELVLPRDVLPNLRNLFCSSAQATAILAHATLLHLESLAGVEFYEQLIPGDFFSWDDDWEEDVINHLTPSPWRGALLETLRSHRSIKRLCLVHGKYSSQVSSLREVARILPHLEVLDVDINNFVRSDQVNEWYALYSHFRHLRVIVARHLIYTQDYDLRENIQEINERIQELARACPLLTTIKTWERLPKVIIIRGQGNEHNVRWVLRPWCDSEELVVRNGEIVYGL